METPPHKRGLIIHYGSPATSISVEEFSREVKQKLDAFKTMSLQAKNGLRGGYGLRMQSIDWWDYFVAYLDNEL